MITKLSNVSLFQRRTVKELLWGYKETAQPLEMGLFLSVSTDAPKHASESGRGQI